MPTFIQDNFASQSDAELLASKITRELDVSTNVVNLHDGWQIRISLPDISIVSHSGSYGGRDGLWEAWDFDDNRDPSGWLNSDDVVNYVLDRI